MKAFFAPLVLAAAIDCRAQDLLSTQAAQQACGPESQRLTKPTLASKQSVVAVPQPGKALVYLFQLYAPHGEPCIGTCGALVRFGIDGRWQGATLGNSYLMASVEAGDHHLCANWQGRCKRLREIVSLKSMHLEAGKSYYFGVRVLEAVSTSFSTYGFDLVALDEDEAKMVRESYPEATSSVSP